MRRRPPISTRSDTLSPDTTLFRSCELLGSLIFINEDPEAQPLLDHIGPMAKELEQYGLENLRLVDSRSYEVNCNVKVLLDAFLEVYHLKSIHQQTVDRFLDHRGMFVTLWPNGHSRMLTPKDRKRVV